MQNQSKRPLLILLFIQFIVMVGFGIVISLMGPTSSSMVTKRSTLGQGASLGYFQAFGSLGRMFGPLIGGALYGIFYGLPNIMGSAFLVIMILTVGRYISEKPAKAENA